MHRIYYLFIAGTFLFGMISCNENNKEESDIVTEGVISKEEDSSADAKVALNPPHGQPGHVCEIPVGQPLPINSKVSNRGQRLNPPHGQPGHVCEIPIGQPLPNESPNGTVPINVNLQTPLMKNHQRLNPPHGQPGHICEIPVGQPFP